MKQLAIQFAQPRRSTGWTRRLAVFVGFFCLGASVWNYATARIGLDRLEADIRDAAANAERRSAMPGVGARFTLPDAQVDAINSAIGQLNLPWSELFRVFDAAKPDTVALIALEPNGRKRTLVVHAEAKTPEHMIAFAEHLKGLPTFEEGFITKHEVRDEDPNRPYRFAVELRWRASI